MKLLFSFRGRISRMQYFAALLIFFGFMLLGCLCIFLPAILPAIGTPLTVAKLLVAVSYLMGWLLIILVLFCNFPTTIKRLHDMGWSRWLAILMLIPYVNIIMQLICLVIPSKPDLTTGQTT